MAAPAGVIVAWPSTVASIPAGWSRFSALDDRLPRPAASSVGTNGGSDTHVHVSPSHVHDDLHGHGAHASQAASSLGTGPAAGGSIAGDHTHTITYSSLSGGTSTGSASGDSSSESSIGFSRYSVVWIESDGSTNIPTGAVAWTAGATVPDDWVACDGAGGTPDLRNRFLRGAAVGADGGSGTAAAAHGHIFSHVHALSTASHAHVYSVSSMSGSTPPFTAIGISRATPGHTHAAGSSASATHPAANSGAHNASSGNESPEPAYVKLLTIQATAAVPAPFGVIGVFDSASPPFRWLECDGTGGTPDLASERFVKGATSVGEIGTTGGSNSHSHSSGVHSHSSVASGQHDTGNTGLSSGSQSAQGGAGNTMASDGHSHLVGFSGTRNGSTSTDNATYPSADATPAHRRMLFIMSEGSDDIALGSSAIEYTGYPVAMADVEDVGAGSVTYTGYPVVVADALPLGPAAVAHIGFPLGQTVIDPTPTTTPTDAQVADALAGKFGPVSTRHRFEWLDSDSLETIADISTAVERASVQLDNNRAILRTARFTLRPSRLPADFVSDEGSLIAVYAEVLVAGVWVRRSLGIFSLDYVSELLTPNSNARWEAMGVDLGSRLMENEFSEPFTIPAGTNYVAEAERICQLAGLQTDFVVSNAVTPVAFPWPPGTSYLQVVNDLLRGINYYPVWATRFGTMRSRPWLDPYLEPIATTYRTDEAPRMIRPGMTRIRERGRYINRAIVSIGSPNRALFAVQVTNDDSDSIVSTVNKGAITSQNISGDRVVDLATLESLGASIVRDAAVKAQTATIRTHPDPRRGAHEFYEVTVEGQEVATRWRVESWDYDCRTGALMQHRIGRANRVDVTAKVLSP